MSTFTSTTSIFFFFFNDTATTEIYTLSLHDALPIWVSMADSRTVIHVSPLIDASCGLDRKSTRLNSSHVAISYAVFCLKQKKRQELRAARRLVCGAAGTARQHAREP